MARVERGGIRGQRLLSSSLFVGIQVLDCDGNVL